MKDKVKIKIKNDEGDIETLWAKSLGEDKYKIENSPFFAYGISWKDIIEAHVGDSGILELKRVIEKSGHRTVRVISKENEIDKDFIKELNNLGCSVEEANNKFIAIDIPEKVNLDAVIKYISKHTYEWEYADPTYHEVNNIN